VIDNKTANVGFTARMKIGNKKIIIMILLSQLFGFCMDVDLISRGVKHTFDIH